MTWSHDSCGAHERHCERAAASACGTFPAACVTGSVEERMRSFSMNSHDLSGVHLDGTAAHLQHLA